MKTEETQVFIKTLRTNIYYQYMDNSHELLNNTAFKPSHFALKQVKSFAFLVITGPSPPHITILYNSMFAIPFIYTLSHKDCKIYASQDHHNHITVALHFIYFKTT